MTNLAHSVPLIDSCAIVNMTSAAETTLPVMTARSTSAYAGCDTATETADSTGPHPDAVCPPSGGELSRNDYRYSVVSGGGAWSNNFREDSKTRLVMMTSSLSSLSKIDGGSGRQHTRRRSSSSSSWLMTSCLCCCRPNRRRRRRQYGGFLNENNGVQQSRSSVGQVCSRLNAILN